MWLHFADMLVCLLDSYHRNNPMTRYRRAHAQDRTNSDCLSLLVNVELGGLPILYNLDSHKLWIPFWFPAL